jgi:hypothetical protein
LDVSFNALTGTIPSLFGDSSRFFTKFRVDNNQLELPFPSFQLSSFLDVCRFENNKICGPRTIPSELVDLFRTLGCSYSINQAALCAGGCGDRSCIGCDGVVGSGASNDACGVCGGTNYTCTDCAGVVYGTARRDPCGVCGGDGQTCADCHGQPNGPAVVDACGVCQGGGESCRDCQGTPAGTARVDACGVCNGRNYSCTDCNGDFNRSARFDEFGICGGSGQSAASTVPFSGWIAALSVLISVVQK